MNSDVAIEWNFLKRSHHISSSVARTEILEQAEIQKARAALVLHYTCLLRIMLSLAIIFFPCNEYRPISVSE